MSVLTYNSLKLVGKAYELKTDRAIEMFGDLWEVYQVGNNYKETTKKPCKTKSKDRTRP